MSPFQSTRVFGRDGLVDEDHREMVDQQRPDFRLCEVSQHLHQFFLQNSDTILTIIAPSMGAKQLKRWEPWHSEM